MISKVIHYCWFGPKPLPRYAKRCINSWRIVCTDYKIIEWNEQNFDIDANIYTKQAYEAGKFAFVSDYARFYIIYNYGGIYMDVDVELVKPLDPLLSNSAFTGFEADDRVNPGLILAATKNNNLIHELLDNYSEKTFINPNNTLNTETVVSYMTKILIKHGLVCNGEKQTIKGMAIYPEDFFSPKNVATGRIHKTANTYSIHHFAGSWVDLRLKLRYGITKQFHRILGEDCFKWLKRSEN